MNGRGGSEESGPGVFPGKGPSGLSSAAGYSGLASMVKPGVFKSAVRLLSGLCAAAVMHAAPLNILLFSSDDMNFDSSGVYGGPVKDLTPNIDRLAAQGIRFEHAYTTVAVCQPARQSMLCGRYPHRNGSFGFFPLRADVVTLNMRLHEAGYAVVRLDRGRRALETIFLELVGRRAA